ncbi:Ldh family oxidoreductase [Mesorhizobium sp. WSM2239]|uniref:Ldh family oxidoreductase n=2 Tax=unclassified Mesorhizobium TaxID=325217 RepID=A0AAU8DI59_9HYPH
MSGPTEAFCRSALLAAGADEPTADAATKAMMHGSLLGVDSHGVRLLDHYVRVIGGGRVNPRPSVRISHGFGAVASLDADDGHGALGAYRGMEHAIGLARKFGVGAVSICNSSHFGAAGAFAMEAADSGLIGLAFCNSDSFVRLHGGAARFHGTNPIACAVPVAGDRPWLLDLATSAIPYNRVKLYASLRQRLPGGIASAADGFDTDDPERVKMLAPLGGEFGFKGAGLAGLAEIFSAVLSGMKLSAELLPMSGLDISTPRKLGAFMMALRPEAFVDRARFDDGMHRYLEMLRNSPARAGEKVMAPGDREWAQAERRARDGIPIDPETEEAFRRLAHRYGLALPFLRGRAPAGKDDNNSTRRRT